MSHFSGDVGVQTGLLGNARFAAYLLIYAAMTEKPIGIMYCKTSQKKKRGKRKRDRRRHGTICLSKGSAVKENER